MTIHLLKLAVGCESPKQLAEFQKQRKKKFGRVYHRTRHAPKRAEELLKDGSIYWIINGYVRVRQRVVKLEKYTDPKEGDFCRLILSPELVPTAPQPRRPHQGWRYLDPKDAPKDRPKSELTDEPPPEMAKELRALGLL